ncbi:hypothetical protein T484DRAFT_1790663 [Baffinella frigidus]|nr:hypothetical protein T484DRAFT_1790663 [Cryptophyta sp. CCMP2293]
MVRLLEFQIPMPCSTEEYRRGQLYMVPKLADEMTKEGAGCECIANDPVEIATRGAEAPDPGSLQG